MGRSATLRYGMDAAPGGLALVQDLLNTAPAGPREIDLLDRAETAMTWWDEVRTSWELAAGPIPAELLLRESDLDGLRTFRDGLRQLVTGNNAGDDGTCNRRAWSPPEATVLLRLGDDGQVRALPRDKGWGAIASVALIEVMEAQRADTWRRFKTCREQLCRAAFYDRSRNNSRVWHDVHICGNAVNLRAHRDRQRVTRSHPTELS